MSATCGSGGPRVARTHRCCGRKSRPRVSEDPTCTCVAHSAAGEPSQGVVDGGFSWRIHCLHCHHRPCERSQHVKPRGCSCAPPPACSLTNFSSWSSSGPYGLRLSSSSDSPCSLANSSADVTTRHSVHGLSPPNGAACPSSTASRVDFAATFRLLPQRCSGSGVTARLKVK